MLDKKPGKKAEGWMVGVPSTVLIFSFNVVYTKSSSSEFRVNKSDIMTSLSKILSNRVTVFFNGSESN